jgi:trehalose/maltose hydrolase-like predicted phosphorylase
MSNSGFVLLKPVRFETQGEEKLVFERIRISFPFKLPAVTTWQLLPRSDGYSCYQAENLAIKIKSFSKSPNTDRLNAGSVIVLEVFVEGSPERVEVKNPAGLTETGIAENGTRFTTILFEQPDEAASPHKVYPSGIVTLDGPIDDQEFLFQSQIRIKSALSREILPVERYGFSPFGIGSELYFGHTFWDMDVWVLPSMLFLQPDAVRQMNKYRLDRAAQAEKNAAEFFKKPNGGMMFPWESSVSGKETVRASSVKEHHISGSVLWGLDLSEKAGIARPAEVGKVADGVSRFFEATSVAGADGREIKDVMSPDENHIGDNDLYTNLLAKWAMNGRRWEGPAKFKLPKDETSFLTYDDDKLRSYKQAAAVLSIFPLQYPEAEKQARAMMERFESKVSKNGPAMSDAIHATVWARLGEKQKAYDAWKRAWKPFVKGPQMMFSEKRSSERTYFYTGAAGCLNTVIYGFAGFRFDDKPLDGAVWKKKLKSGWWLSCKPCLPPKWKSLKINPMVIDGQKYSVEIDQEKVRIEPL